MADERILCDVKDFTSRVLNVVKKTGWVEERREDELYDIYESIENLMAGQLGQYNKQYENKLRDIEELKKEKDGEIARLNEKIQEQDESMDRTIQQAISNFRRDRDEAIKKLDDANVEFEKEKADFEDSKRKMEVEAQEHRRTEGIVKLALERAEKAVEENEKETDALQKKIDNLTSEKDDYEKTIAKQKADNDSILQELENNDKEIGTLRKEVKTLTDQNDGLKQKTTKLKQDVQQERQKSALMVQDLKQTQAKLEDAEEKYQRLRRKTETPEPELGAPTSLADEIAGLLPSNAGSVNSARYSEENSIDSTQSSRQATSIEGDYIMRATHEKEMQELRDESAAHQAEADSLKEQLKTEQEKCTELQQKVDDFENQVAELNAETKRLTDDAATHQTAVDALNQALAAERSSIMESNRRIEELEKEVAELKSEHEKEVKRLADENTQCKEELKKMQAELEDKTKDANDQSQELQQKLATQQAAVEKLKQELDAAKEEIAALQAQAETIRDAKESVEKDLLDARSTVAQLQATILSQETALEAQRVQIDALTKRPTTTGVATQTDLPDDDRDKKEDVIKDLKDQIEALEAQLEKATQDLRDYEANASTNADALKQAQDQVAALEKSLRDCQEAMATTAGEDVVVVNLDEDGDGDEDADDVFKAIRRLLRAYLAIQSPTVTDVNNLLTDLINLQRTIPDAQAFGPVSPDDNKKPLDDCEEERKRLEDENNQLAAQVANLIDTVTDQNKEINDSIQRGAVSQTDLARLIASMQTMQQDLTQTLAQGDTPPEKLLDRVQQQIRMFQDMIGGLRVQAQLQQDGSRLAGNVLQRTEQRENERLAMSGSEAGSPLLRPAMPGSMPETPPMNAAMPVPGGRGWIVTRFLNRVFGAYAAQFGNAFVAGAMLAVFFIMVAATVAESRLYTVWLRANAESRAAYVRVYDRSTICIGAPDFSYFFASVLGY